MKAELDTHSEFVSEKKTVWYIGLLQIFSSRSIRFVQDGWLLLPLIRNITTPQTSQLIFIDALWVYF